MHVLRAWMLERLMNLSPRYCGARLFRHLYSISITTTLCSSNCFTDGQFNWRSKGATWSYFLDFVTILLTKVWIDYSFPDIST